MLLCIFCTEGCGEEDMDNVSIKEKDTTLKNVYENNTQVKLEDFFDTPLDSTSVYTITFTLSYVESVTFTVGPGITSVTGTFGNAAGEVSLR